MSKPNYTIPQVTGGILLLLSMLSMFLSISMFSFPAFDFPNPGDIFSWEGISGMFENYDSSMIIDELVIILIYILILILFPLGSLISGFLSFSRFKRWARRITLILSYSILPIGCIFTWLDLPLFGLPLIALCFASICFFTRPRVKEAFK